MKNTQLSILLFLCCLYFSSNSQVELELDSTLRNISLDDVVVTAQYAPTAAENAVHQVKVIKAIEIQEQGQNNLAEVLTNQLNLRVNNDPILGNGLRIQGIGGENIQIMIDGVPVIGRVNGNIDLSQINLQNVQRIEIVEGAMSAQYGSNASGGVVNIITKKSQLEKIRIQSQNQYENIGITNNSLTVGSQLNKTYVSLTGYRNNSQFTDVNSLRLLEEIELADGTISMTKINPWNPKIQYGLDGILRHQFNNSTNVTYQYRWFNEKLSSYGEMKRPQFRPYAFDEFYTTNRQDHSVNFESYFSEKLYLNSTTAYNRFSREKETQRLDFEPDKTSLVLGGQDTTRFNSFLHRSILSTTTKNVLNGQFGIEILHETGVGQRIVDSTSRPLNEAEISNYALWASLQYTPNKIITIQGNLRYGHNTKYDHPLIPSVHLSWKPTKKWEIQWSYAHGFRSPSLKELHFNFIDINHYIVGNPNLKAEHSRNTSLNVQYNKTIAKKHQLSFSGKLFYNYIENRIVIAEFAPFQFNYQNLDKFETHGVNFRFQYNFDNKLSIKSGLAYTRLFNFWSTDFDTDKFTELYEMQNEVSYLVPYINARMVMTHRFIGKQVRFYENDEGVLEEGFIGDYHLVNLSISRDFWKRRIFVSLGSKNLLDTQSVPFVGQSDGAHNSVGNSQLLNWGRTYFARLNLSF